MIRHATTLLVIAITAMQASAQIPSTVPSADDEKVLSMMFEGIDADRNGRITKVEMSAFGAAHGIGAIVRSEGWKDMDDDRNGTLSKQEFITGMVKARAAKAARQAK